MPHTGFTRSCCPISSSNRLVSVHNRTLRCRSIVGLFVLMAATGAGTAHALPEDADQPIHIRADSAEVDQQAEQVVYRGSVQVNQGTLLVTADEMTIEYEAQKVVRIIATGTPAHYRQQLETDDDLVKADASTIVYHTKDERIDLRGNASLEQQGNTLTGDLIQYDIVAGKVDASASGSDPIKMVLQPARRTSAPPETLTPQENSLTPDSEG